MAAPAETARHGYIGQLSEVTALQLTAAPPSVKDPDGDGQNNQFEFIAGVIPTSAAPRFTLDIQHVPGQPGQKRLVFSPRLTDRTYTVQSLLNPSAGPWATLTGATSSDAGNARTVTDPNAAGLRKFYRVQIQKP